MSMLSSIAESVNAIAGSESLAPLADIQGVINESSLQDIMGQLHIDSANGLLQGLPLTEGLSDSLIHADSVPDSRDDGLDSVQSASQLQDVLQQLNTVLQERHDSEVHVLDNLHASTDADDGAIVAHADNDVAPAAHDDASAVHDDASAA